MVLLILESELKLVGDTFGECEAKFKKINFCLLKIVQINLTDLE